MREKMRRERMGIEPTHRLLGGAQDLKFTRHLISREWQ
jgi:hypothetical protein